MSEPMALPCGTVYGVLMNFASEHQALAAQMLAPPYKAPPQAPVLYIKTANTYSASGAPITLASGVAQITVGASIAMGFNALAGELSASSAINSIAYWRLMLDLSLPQTSFYRPPVRFNCQDGFLGLGAPLPSALPLALPPLQLSINGALVQTIEWGALQRPPLQLLQDVGEFTRLRPGDELMLGCEHTRPTARVGDLIELHAEGFPPLTHTLVAAP